MKKKKVAKAAKGWATGWPQVAAKQAATTAKADKVAAAKVDKDTAKTGKLAAKQPAKATAAAELAANATFIRTKAEQAALKAAAELIFKSF